MEYDSLYEAMVYNAVNETNLEYIGIFGLFDRYNIEIPFEKQVNIFIGENGLGKTTILNCIYYILEKQFSKLTDIQFSEIKIKFRSDSKIYTISFADINEYNRNKRYASYKYYSDKDIYIADIIENIILHDNTLDEDDIDHKLERISFELARTLDMPINVAKRQIRRYINNKEINSKNRRKGNKNNVVDLIKAISTNVSHRIIYLPTYRRIEDDFASLNLRNEELNQTELLIKFGMSDVQTSINRILDRIRSLAMKGFTEMTGILLKQYADGKDPMEEIYSNTAYTDLNFETVKIVLDRVGKEIEESYKKKILDLVSNGEINKYEYLYLWNLINKLIDNYKLQKAYDDRIKKFADTCNKYLINKYFYYNPSTLNLDIFLDNDLGKKSDIIQLTQLSSGEKQIVSLFSKLYLESDEKSIVIIDEPELSLSLQWQKMLLPDIMRTENCDLLLTVTHSPFIFENEFDYDAKEIRRYIEKYKRG
jgi:predicted ATP-dependent endonuclease of OLD family